MRIPHGIFDYKREIGGTPYPTDGLLARWTFDNSDLVDTEHSYTLTASGAGTISFESGKIGNCVHFYNKCAYISEANIYDAVKTWGTFSYSFWFKSSTTNDAGYFYGCSYNDNQDANRVSMFGYSSGSRIIGVHGYGTGADADWNMGTGYLADGNWHHYVWTFNNSKVGKLFVDTIQKGGDYTFSQAAGTSINMFSINGRGATPNTYGTAARDRYFDSCYVYNKALTTEEITQLYNGGSGI